MKVDSNNNISFSGLYASKKLTGFKQKIVERISQQLLEKSPSGKSYVAEIENLGYDILIISPEIRDRNTVRMCIIKDFKSKKLPDGGYDILDAKIIRSEVYESFSAQEFYDDVKRKTAKWTFSLKNIFKFF